MKNTYKFTTDNGIRISVKASNFKAAKVIAEEWLLNGNSSDITTGDGYVILAARWPDKKTTMGNTRTLIAD